MGFSGKYFPASRGSPAVSDEFIRLIEIAEEDKSIHDTLLSILSMDRPRRQLALEELLEKMQGDGAPKDFVDTIAVLRDDAIAEKALDILTDE